MNRAVFAAVFLKRFLLVLAEYAAQNSIFIVENITVRVTQQTRIFFSVDFEQVIDGFGKLKIPLYADDPAGEPTRNVRAVGAGSLACRLRDKCVAVDNVNK